MLSGGHQKTRAFMQQHRERVEHIGERAARARNTLFGRGLDAFRGPGRCRRQQRSLKQSTSRGERGIGGLAAQQLSRRAAGAADRFGTVGFGQRRATSASDRKASMSANPNGGTRMVTTRDRMVGRSAPGSLLVRISVVLDAGSSSSLRNALAA